MRRPFTIHYEAEFGVMGGCSNVTNLHTNVLESSGGELHKEGFEVYYGCIVWM